MPIFLGGTYRRSNFIAELIAIDEFLYILDLDELTFLCPFDRFLSPLTSTRHKVGAASQATAERCAALTRRSIDGLVEHADSVTQCHAWTCQSALF